MPQLRIVVRLAWVVLAGVLVVPVPAAAQLGAIEALASRISHLSFYGTLGGLTSASSGLERSGLGVSSYGLEVLFEVGSIDEIVGPAPPPTDSVVVRWTSMMVERRGRRADTTYHYEVVPAPASAPETRAIWLFELGLGYGQTVGFQASDPSRDLRGMVRDLPSISLYASYAPVGFYAGLRSGFMRVQGLQVYEDDASVVHGEADSFLAGAMVGQSFAVLGLDLFIEAAYTVRDFSSVTWDAVPPPSLRSLDLSGWSIGTGVQFALGGG